MRLDQGPIVQSVVAISSVLLSLSLVWLLTGCHFFPVLLPCLSLFCFCENFALMQQYRSRPLWHLVILTRCYVTLFQPCLLCLCLLSYSDASMVDILPTAPIVCCVLQTNVVWIFNWFIKELLINIHVNIYTLYNIASKRLKVTSAGPSVLRFAWMRISFSAVALLSMLYYSLTAHPV